MRRVFLLIKIHEKKKFFFSHICLKGFDELLQLAERGDHRNVDTLVKDIYGGDYSSQSLPGDLIASSFGKAMGCNRNLSKFSKCEKENLYSLPALLRIIFSFPAAEYFSHIYEI